MSPNRGFLRTIFTAAVMLAVLISFSGCSDDNDLSTPEETFGTIEVRMPAENIGATWHLYGPGDSFRHGDTDLVLDQMPSGQYTIIWTAVDEWTAPAPDRRTLTASSTLTLNGQYEDKAPGSNFVLVPTGGFVMGSENGTRITLPDSTRIPAEMGRDTDEVRHHVGLGSDFHLQKYEITNQEYVEKGNWAIEQGLATTTESALLDGLDGSTIELLNFDFADTPIDVQDGMLRLKKPEYANRPLVEVTWYGAASYCDWISLQEGLGRAYDHMTWEVFGGDVYNSTAYRLPTEAEWEYACRAGTVTAFSSGEIETGSCDEPVLTGTAWFCGNAGNNSHDVGTKAANPWGLFDMHGNVWEWCNDYYGHYEVDEGYLVNPDTVIYLIDPVGPESGQNRVVRGGRFLLASTFCRSAGRMMGVPDFKGENIGFRPAITATP